MDRPHQVLYCGFGFHRRDSFCDQLCCLGSDDVDAQDLAVVGITDNLDKALMLAHYAGTTVRGERKFADLHVVSGFTSLRFRQPYAADFGMAISCTGNSFAIDRLARLTRDLRHGDQAFHRTDVRQLWSTKHDV